MNNWKEKYPQSVAQLVEVNLSIAVELEHNLNSKDCPQLSDLYLNQKNTIRRQVNKFNDLKYTSNTKGSKRIKSNNEYRGLYVFAEEINGEVKPVYVGISRTIFRRLKQHGWGTKHNQGTLAYLIAIDKFYKGNYEGERKDVEDDKLEFGKNIVQNFKVALIHVPEDFDLYFLKVTLAGHWKTKWNSFRTH